MKPSSIRRGEIRGQWYHGDLHRRTTFTDQEMDRGQGVDPNALGPGIYWTRDRDQASGYAESSGWLYTAVMKTTAKRVILDKTKPRKDLLAKFLDLAPEESKYYGLTNWGTEPNAARSAAVAAYMDSPSLHDAFSGIYHDFYSHDWKEYGKALIAVGFDAFLHSLPEVDHLVVWNPKIISVVEEIQKSKSASAVRYRGLVYSAVSGEF